MANTATSLCCRGTKRALLILLFLSITLLSYSPVNAQETSGPIYIVQPNEYLSDIAARFNVSVEALMQANGIADANQIYAGQTLIIPGLEGISGVLQTEFINFGESYHSLIRQTQVNEALFRKINRVVSPSEFYVGASMIVPTQDGGQSYNTRVSPASGESLLELAVKQNTDTWTISTINSLGGSWDGLPGDTLYAPGGSSDQSASGLPSAFISAEIRDLPIKQGGTGEIKAKINPGVTLGGILVDHQLHFFPMEDGTQVALQGVHALLEPGVYPLRLDATLPDGSVQSYEQPILIVSGDYQEITISVSPEYLDPAVTEPELQQIVAIVSNVSPDKYWQDTYQIPVALPYCIKDWFGIRRTYLGIGSDITTNGWHSGVDYGICSEANPYDIYAPAAGKVVFSGLLTIRGNATIIDHGWGVYSGIWHQKESLVTVGQDVTAGQMIGQIGETGRVTGPHLHWELWVNGIQVDPLDWLERAYP